jgi:hypothetical protein
LSNACMLLQSGLPALPVASGVFHIASGTLFSHREIVVPTFESPIDPLRLIAPIYSFCGEGIGAAIVVGEGPGGPPSATLY